MLLGMLDLETWQPSYTVMSLLIDLEVARRATGERDMEIEFNPGTIKGFGRYHRWPREHEDKVKCLNNIALPMCHMLPGVTSVRFSRSGASDPRTPLGALATTTGVRL
jgi:hypothetical protein